MNEMGIKSNVPETVLIQENRLGIPLPYSMATNLKLVA